MEFNQPPPPKNKYEFILKSFSSLYVLFRSERQKFKYNIGFTLVLTFSTSQSSISVSEEEEVSQSLETHGKVAGFYRLDR